MIHIMYHTDSDGHAAAAVVLKMWRDTDGQKHPEMLKHEVRMCPMNYGYSLPRINYKEDYVYMVDFSLQPDAEMLKFAAKLESRLVWIDHHQSSVEMCRAYPELECHRHIWLRL